jgi:ATP-dependent RNA helicase DDX52/ROK1
MEAFNLLSRGGAKFDKRRFQKDVKLFTSVHSNEKSNISTAGDDQLPADLDFFKYAQSAGASKRKDSQTEEQSKKRQKVTPNEQVNDDGDEYEDNGEASSSIRILRHRVTTKGSNIPPPIHTFEDLKERYDVPSRLLTNLRESGYRTPTAIQAYASPILLQSRDLAAISPTGTGKTLSYLLPIFASLRAPSFSKSKADDEPSSSRTEQKDIGEGVHALIIAPTRELAHQIHNECLKLAQGRKWRTVLFSKATAATLADKNARDHVGMCYMGSLAHLRLKPGRYHRQYATATRFST